jgi:hypothetical protein
MLEIGSRIILTIELVLAWFILIFDVAVGGADSVEDAAAIEETNKLDPVFDCGEDWTDEIDKLPTDRDVPADDDERTGDTTELCD